MSVKVGVCVCACVRVCVCACACVHVCVRVCVQLEEVKWRLNLQLAQSTRTKMKLPNALFELSVRDGEVSGRHLMNIHYMISYSLLFITCHFFSNSQEKGQSEAGVHSRGTV